MKKQLLIISIIVVIVSIFVSCSVNSISENISTTAVTDSNGTTHYYEPVTDDEGNISTTAKNKGVFAEIETQSNGKAVTKKNGEYVTNEHTTALSIENVTDRTSSTTKSATEKLTTVFYSITEQLYKQTSAGQQAQANPNDANSETNTENNNNEGNE